MASLPNKPFLINYNARDYNPATYTFPKTPGQLFDQDFVLTYSPSYVIPYTEDGYISVNGANGRVSFNTTDDNPFNRYNTETGRTFTAIAKMTTNSGNVFANRDINYNWMFRWNMFHTSTSGFLEFTPTTSPATIVVRVSADGSCERKCIETGQIMTSPSIDWGRPSEGATLFGGYVDGAEGLQGDFYWLYISNETLTDAEITKVIAYNEGAGTSFDPEEISASYQASSYTVTVEADETMPWTAYTTYPWIDLDITEGTGTTQITVTVEKNTANTPRTGLVELEDGDNNTATLTIHQEKHPLLIPNNNLYIGGTLIN